MGIDEIMKELESMGTDRMKKYYMGQGAIEPVFGVATGAMKPIAKKYKNNQAVAEALYATGNYDAMYLAGMIADVSAMTPDDYDRWIEKAYFHMISDFIVAVTLAESDFAQEVADRFIASDKELVMSAGWSCYEWLLGSRKDNEFDVEKLRAMLKNVEENIHNMPNRTKNAMNGFLIATGISFKPLHEEALSVAQRIGEVKIDGDKKSTVLRNAYDSIMKETEKGRLGFKRRHVRC
jgi:3-methyladenine DNA glycosylase AlkD